MIAAGGVRDSSSSIPIRRCAPPWRTRLAARLLMGIAMGLTAMALIYSPLGARSGAHLNPATTMTFLRLGRMHAVDAAAYVVAQFAGGLAGISIAAALLARWIDAPSVRYVATVPGEMWGDGGGVRRRSAHHVRADDRHPARLQSRALVALHRRLRGLLVALYITIRSADLRDEHESGALARAGAALGRSRRRSGSTSSAPAIGMLSAAELFVRTRGLHAVFCAKLHHHTAARCIFHCRFSELS